jgi:hypothetical protein
LLALAIISALKFSIAFFLFISPVKHVALTPLTPLTVALYYKYKFVLTQLVNKS